MLNSVGKLCGKVKHKEQVDTVGSTVSSENAIDGEVSINPSGGGVSIPVRKTITSLRFGDR